MDSCGPACFYVEPDTHEGSCLFGRAFLALGVDPDELLPLNMAGIEDVLGISDEDLGSAQGAQDAGIPWGEAPREHLLAFLNWEPA